MRFIEKRPSEQSRQPWSYNKNKLLHSEYNIQKTFFVFIYLFGFHGQLSSILKPAKCLDSLTRKTGVLCPSVYLTSPPVSEVIPWPWLPPWLTRTSRIMQLKVSENKTTLIILLCTSVGVLLYKLHWNTLVAFHFTLIVLQLFVLFFPTRSCLSGIFIYPLEENSIVVGFESMISNQIITLQIKEKAKIEDCYLDCCNTSNGAIQGGSGNVESWINIFECWQLIIMP